MLDRPAESLVSRGTPAHIRSDNDSELTARRVRRWLRSMDAETLQIEPVSPRENGCVESSNGKLHGELLNREIFYTPRYRPSAPKAVQVAVGLTTVRPQVFVLPAHCSISTFASQGA